MKLRQYFLVATIWVSDSIVATCFEIPLPGGRRIKFDDGGIIRIQLQDAGSLPRAPSPQTSIDAATLACIEVRDTGTIKGFGAFCTKPIQKETFLGFYEGEFLTSKGSTEDLARQVESMDYILSLDGGTKFLDGFQRAKDRSNFSPVHMNHADKESSTCNCIRVLSNGQVAFFTSREVDAGEELCFDYGKNYWRDREEIKLE